MARKKVTTPVGTARYPYLNQPDTKFNSNGVWRVELLFDPDNVEEFLERLDNMADAAVADAKEDLQESKPQDVDKVQRKAPYEPVYDDDGNKTGEVKVKFKSKHKVETDDGIIEIEPDLFDSKGNPVDRNSVNIQGGSKLRVNFTPKPYYMASTKQAGVSLQLNAVQIIELVESFGNADYYGFDEHEDGFDAEKELDESEPNEDDGFVDGDQEDFTEEDF